MASKFDNRGIVQPSGVMEIKFNVTKPTNIIKFHAHTAFIKIKSIEISSVAKYSFIKNETIFPDIVVLTLNENLLPNNEIQMKIRYNTKVVLNDTIGIFRGQSLNFQTLKNENYYVTQLESIELRKVFPSFDDISIKAKFTFSLKHFKTMTAISTSAIKRIDINGVYAISHFDETITMSTYVFGFALSSFRSTTFISNNNVTLKVWAPHEQYYTSLLVGETQIGIFNELTKYFKTPYILPKIDTMMLPKFKYGGMENVGLIVIDGNSVKYIHAVTNSNSILIVNLIAHELIHQWIGNLVTPKEWKYIWLSEGITKFLEFLITDKLHPNMFPNHKYISFDLIYHRTAMEVDSTENFHPVEFYFDPSTEAFVKHFSFSYYKGFCITQMIYHLLGDKQFEKGINAYIANYAYKSVSSNDFFAVMDRYVEKRQPNSPNLIEVGLSWTSQAGFPLITVTQRRTICMDDNKDNGT
uniref:Peptidase_M1 domain-containing protein n=1 Tax=Rhabditophanes sp. KR3021 TaxID=114890 RepID=A0AC35TM46_9BILA